MAAASLVALGTKATPLTLYNDHTFTGTKEDKEISLRTTTTVYVGNLGFSTTEEQIYELFSRAGEVRRIIMGLDKQKRTPCGFCFVQYKTRESTENCMAYVNGTRLDDRIIRTDLDIGFSEGRQFGRGKRGGQSRDEYRFDEGRSSKAFSESTQSGVQ